MQIAFAGTPDFAVPALDALFQAGHSISAVFTRPDKPAGRGLQLAPSAVAMRAGQLGMQVFKPERFDAEAIRVLDVCDAEVLVVVAYGLILPPEALAMPRFGAINIHASLLPRWRGAAPLQRAILAGDTETGVTIMQMDAGLDTGPMLLWEAVPLTTQTAGELHDGMAALGGRLVVAALDKLARGDLTAAPQPAEGVIYAKKLDKEEARLDFSLPAAELSRRTHGYNPFPGAWCMVDDERVKVLRADPIDVPTTPALAGQGPFVPGTVRKAGPEGLFVACGPQGAEVLRVSEIQRPGARPQSGWAAFGGRIPEAWN